MFHVKHFCPKVAQNLTRPKTAASFRHIRSPDFLVRFQKPGGGPSIAASFAETHLPCKISLRRAAARSCAGADFRASWTAGGGDSAGQGMADIFVSYTSSDKDWAFWIGQELEALGHVPHIHEWEISGGANIMAWVTARTDAAAHVLCVVSEKYLKAPYSSLERTAAEWAAVSRRPNFAVPVFVEPCEPPILLAPFERCDLHGITEDEARARLAVFLTPAARPAGPMRFPGGASAEKLAPAPPAPVAFPGVRLALSNIPIRLPLHSRPRGCAGGGRKDAQAR
jgi:TIR domain